MTTFTYAGVSTLKGVTKVRWANDATRVKVLAKNGHKDIDLVQLKHPMRKEEAVEYLLNEIRMYEQNGVVNKITKAALEAELDKRTKEPKAAKGKDKQGKEAKKPKKDKPTKAKKTKAIDPEFPSLEEIRARSETEVPTEGNLEDAPF